MLAGGQIWNSQLYRAIQRLGGLRQSRPVHQNRTRTWHAVRPRDFGRLGEDT